MTINQTKQRLEDIKATLDVKNRIFAEAKLYEEKLFK
jgi:hypothetical protein